MDAISNHTLGTAEVIMKKSIITPIKFAGFLIGMANDSLYTATAYNKEVNKYRGVLRLNAYFYDCKQSTNLGGCALQRNIETEKKQLCLLQKKWGKRIVQTDTTISHKTNKKRSNIDYNPIIKIPINGV